MNEVIEYLEKDIVTSEKELRICKRDGIKHFEECFTNRIEAFKKAISILKDGNKSGS
jgi:hypothetical protein